MTEVLCQVCKEQPKKYKCPTCSAPYCSLTCFKLHKTNHDNDAAPAHITSQPAPRVPEVPQPPVPEPLPRYLKQKVDYSLISSNPRFRELLKAHPTLLSSLQRVYAATIEPDPSAQDQGHFGTSRGFRGRGRGRGRGDMGRGRGRGRGDRFGGSDARPKWTPKKGDADAMRLLKRYRDGKQTPEESEGMGEFVKFVEEVLGDGHREAEIEGNVQIG